jgi:uncharacterized protein YdeI (BOF family)
MMKQITKILAAVFICCISFSTFAQIDDPLPIAVCQMVYDDDPTDELDVVTMGVVTDTPGDQFELTQNGCTIICDVGVSNMPEQGMTIVLVGTLQVEDEDEDLKIQVRWWTPINEDPPENPEPYVFTVEDALNSEEGTIALLLGVVDIYEDEDDGEGSFVDATGSITIDFNDGDSPAVQQSVYVMGTVEESILGGLEIEVWYWYLEGDDGPGPPPDIAWSIDDANSLPLGSSCLILGSVTSWTDEDNFEGVFDDSTSTMGIHFDGISLPLLYNTVYAFGITVEDENNFRVIECPVYLDLYTQPLYSICDIVNEPVNQEYIITVGIVTEIIDDDEYMLTLEDCSMLCNGEVNDIPAEGNTILIDGIIEYEQNSGDLSIDTDYWLLIDEGESPPPDPPATVYTVEDAIISPVGTIAELTGDVLVYIDEVTGLASFTDATGTMDMDFAGGDLPQVGYTLIVEGVVESENASPNKIDVFIWYYEDGEPPPPQPDPIGWSIGELGMLPVASYCFVKGAVTSWTDENEGVGIYKDVVDSINIDFADEVESLPSLNDSIYVLGQLINFNGVMRIKAYFWIGENIVAVDDQVILKHNIQVYPNPAKNVLYIDSEEQISRAVIYGIGGEIIREVNQFDISTINISGLKTGVYVLSLYSDNIYMGTKKLIIE